MPDETANIQLIIFENDGSASWTAAEQVTIQQAAMDVAQGLAREVNRKLLDATRVRNMVIANREPLEPVQLVSPVDVFLKTYGEPVVFRRRSITASEFFEEENNGAWGFTLSRKRILIFKNAPAFREGRSSVSQTPQFSVHELGHAFENAVAASIGAKRGRNSLTRDLYDNRRGFSQKGAFQQSKTKGSDQSGRGEIFADMFIGWAYGEWEIIDGLLTADGLARKDFMDRMMLGLIEDAMKRNE